jgi:hypothetical protein
MRVQRCASAATQEANRKVPQMQTYPVDTDPEQIVRWVIAEHQVSPSTLKTVARRTTEVQEIPARRELHLGDEEREDLSEVTTVATAPSTVEKDHEHHRAIALR